MTILSAAMILFLVMDPIGNTACFSILLKDVDSRRHRWIVLREVCIALLILVIFLFAGRELLDFLDISQASLGISGGVILFLIAIDMIFHGSSGHFTTCEEEEPFIVPMAIPLVAGPSAMATVMLLMAREPEKWLNWFLALLLAWFASSLILMFSKQVGHFLGSKGLAALTRLMGMILIIVAVEMLIKGANQAFLH
jgi:multiple antibiotic resistance protein